MIQFVIIILLLTIAAKLFWPDLVKLKGRVAKKLVLDSCALIDGRILDLAQAGFVVHQLIVPEFVVHELQLLADGADPHKRERARFGLDTVKTLQATADVVVVMDHSVMANGPTDDKLVALCHKLSAELYTTDFNLQKVAEIAGITVLNVNDLAQKLRPVALPGERKIIKILQKGNNPQQGIGYLEDGTMIVVENGAKYRGKMAEVEVTRTHQTVSGKMLFAQLVAVQAPKPEPTRQPAPRFKGAASSPRKLALKRPKL